MNIKKMYHEVFFTSIFLNFLDAFLTAAAAFSIVYFIAYFYRLSFLIAVAIGVIFFIRSIILKIKQNKIILLEKKFPELKEKLRTSFDYQDKSNTVINELHSEIINIMKKVDLNAFLNNKTISIKLLLVVFMLMSTLYLSSIGFDILDIKSAVVNSELYKRTVKFTQDIFDETREEVKNRPLLQDPRLIAVGSQELNISIDTYNTELDINDIGDAEKNDFGGHYPEEISGAAQEIYQDQIPEEHRDVVKEYFKKISR